MTTSTIHEIFQDAGLLREYVAQHYGAVLTDGGSPATYFRGMRLISRLSRMTGLDMETVLTSIQSDYEAAN